MSGGIFHFAPSYDPEQSRADHERLLQALSPAVRAESRGSGTIVPDPISPAKRQRKPSVGTLIKQAEKSGKPVTSVTTPDGTVLHFGEPEQATQSNPWDEVLSREPH
jgi:hypothetical protein